VKFWEVTDASSQAEKYVVEDPKQQLIVSLIERWKTQRPDGMIKDNKLYFTLATVQIGLGMEPLSGNSYQNREMGGILQGLYGKPRNTTGPKGQQKYYIIELST
jgi:hypothetical protein